ncbi:MAG: hypothetical protein NNA31_12420 [Nitrospira sp.]|nr:hypothetical protein [Nitrospira sp.]
MRAFVQAAVSLALLFAGQNGHAALWRCTQPDGTTVFQDGGGPTCRKVDGLSELQSTRFPRGENSADGRRTDPISMEGVSVPNQTEKRSVSSRPFPATSRVVPALSVRDLPLEWRAKGWNLPNKGDIQLLQVDVSHLAEGNGPAVSADYHFMSEARLTLGTAVSAAAKAVRYDPRFLKVHVTIPMAAGSLHTGVRVDGPSAGGFWAVAVASAILGDELRQDLCFSGTIDSDLAIGPVEGLEHKIEGCRLLRQFHELMIPGGQRTFALMDKGMARSIKVTEVSTLAEAYEIATGRPLRPAP